MILEKQYKYICFWSIYRQTISPRVLEYIIQLICPKSLNSTRKIEELGQNHSMKTHTKELGMQTARCWHVLWTDLLASRREIKQFNLLALDHKTCPYACIHFDQLDKKKYSLWSMMEGRSSTYYWHVLWAEGRKWETPNKPKIGRHEVVGGSISLRQYLKPLYI